MRRLFRAFERERVRYLLIGGQATILYGAATFSEDVDLWIDPAPRNLRLLWRALATAGARVYKLTPPLTPTHVRAGHGFHFVLPAGPLPAYLDVMGCPPRVGPFGPAARRAVRLATPVGTLPVVGVEDLVPLKRTQRAADYDAISNLVRIRLEEAAEPGRALVRWAIANTFHAGDLDRWLRVRPAAAASRPAARWLRDHPGALPHARALLAAEMAHAQSRDAAHWRRRIRALRRLRSRGALLAEGARVEAPR